MCLESEAEFILKGLTSNCAIKICKKSDTKLETAAAYLCTEL